MQFYSLKEKKNVLYVPFFFMCVFSKFDSIKYTKTFLKKKNLIVKLIVSE